MRKVILTTKAELDIYMSPMRQQILRELSIAKAPMTPKMLADRLQISASGVQHHIKKLMLLGLMELDRTELVNGITASFYKLAQVSVQIGLGQSEDLAEQREVLVQSLIAQVYEGFRRQMKRISGRKEKNASADHEMGDILSGVVYLNEQESAELMKLITEFIEQHSAPASDRSPWEYALILYNAEEKKNE